MLKLIRNYINPIGLTVQGVVELHGVLRDAFEEELPSTMPNQASGFEDQKAGILR
jgi:hypothetical protein